MKIIVKIGKGLMHGLANLGKGGKVDNPVNFFGGKKPVEGGLVTNVKLIEASQP